jgi:hypothetical protein
MAVSRRTSAIFAASLAGHAALVALLLLHAPELRVPIPESGPPQAIIPVIIIARTPTPPNSSAASRPSPVRLHRRPQRFVLEDLPLAPLVSPLAAPTTSRPAPATSGPRTLTAPQVAAELESNVRAALRSRLNCDSPTLTRDEREACRRRFAAGAQDAPFLGLGVDAAKTADLARAAARREEDYAYSRSNAAPVGVSGSGYNAGVIQRPGQPNMGMGATGGDLGRMTGNDRPEAKAPL